MRCKADSIHTATRQNNFFCFVKHGFVIEIGLSLVNSHFSHARSTIRYLNSMKAYKSVTHHILQKNKKKLNK